MVIFPRGLIDRHDPAGVQRRFAVFVIGREDFELRVHDSQLAGVAVELDFSEQRDAKPGHEHVGR